MGVGQVDPEHGKVNDGPGRGSGEAQVVMETKSDTCSDCGRALPAKPESVGPFPVVPPPPEGKPLQSLGLLLAVPLLVLLVPQVAIQRWELAPMTASWLQWACRFLAVVSLGASLWTYLGWRQKAKDHLAWKRAG
jgi:hypothetical protein